MNKLSYSTETTVEVPGAALSVARYATMATSSSTAGYFGGGLSPSIVSTMDKLTYSTDTTADVPGAALSVARGFGASTGNTTHGYTGGGGTGPAYSTMDKTTYSSDTTAAAPGANLSLARGFQLGATGNSTHGYFGGGRMPGPTYSTLMDKVTYSSDTTAAVPGASLRNISSGAAGTADRYGLAATGNSDAGYFGGGNSTLGTAQAKMDKLIYSTDTTTAVPSANLPLASVYHGATGNSGAGYFGSGNPGPQTIMQKITYSADTTALVPSAEFTTGRRYITGASAKANAVAATTNIV